MYGVVLLALELISPGLGLMDQDQDQDQEQDLSTEDQGLWLGSGSVIKDQG